ncbi:MAG: ferrous iron transport protein B [bacterium]|nr:ferrous iron transport protein B [bacterium]
MAAKGKLTVALAGNPNSGKSTIFNNLTGAHQHVGNYPGVTVEKKEGRVVYKDYEITFVDLPGTYSLSANSEDEIVARDFIIKEKPDMVVHIVDASNLERNLYLYTQLQELEVPIILAMNMSDIVEKRGSKINYVEISRLLGKPVIPAVGSKNKGMNELLNAVVDLREGKSKIEKIGVDYGEEVKLELEKLAAAFKKAPSLPNEYPVGWLGIKLLENDPWIIKLIAQLPGGPALLLEAERSRIHLKKHFSDDPEVIIADRRYGFISGVCTEAQTHSVEERHDLSDKIDKVVLNRFLGLPIFAAVMYAIFKFTFTFSEPVVGWFEKFFEKTGEIASGAIPEGLTQSFIVDGVIGGVGGVLGFFPLVLFMFFAIAFFEDSGYMARAAFVMDRIMHKFGLHGKSFLPMMISTNGCAVPGIMASRTLDNKKDRLITMMVTPFMICGAKLPIFALFIGAFFAAKDGANMMFLMYALSVIIAFVSAWILKKFVFKGETSHFVMELPPYRIPTIQGLLLKMWERGWLYIKKAGTIILLISMIIWAGFTFPEKEPKEGASEEAAASAQMEQSYAGRIGKFVEPAVKPLGMDWRGGVALMAGVAAKEVVVSTMGTIYSLGEVDPEETDSLKEALQKDPSWNPLKALVFLIFCLIYLPCFVAIAVFYRESGPSLKWTLFLIFWTTVMAWVASFIVYQGGRLLGFGG